MSFNFYICFYFNAPESNNWVINRTLRTSYIIQNVRGTVNQTSRTECHFSGFRFLSFGGSCSESNLLFECCAFKKKKKKNSEYKLIFKIISVLFSNPY